MKKILWLIITLPTLAFGQICSVNNNGERTLIYMPPGGHVAKATPLLISTDTVVIHEGDKLCKHYFVSRDAEEQEERHMHAVLYIERCMPEHEDFLICCKCLRHLKIIKHQECIIVRQYSELLKDIECKNNTP
jgi:hypothetical protein